MNSPLKNINKSPTSQRVECVGGVVSVWDCIISHMAKHTTKLDPVTHEKI